MNLTSDKIRNEISPHFKDIIPRCCQDLGTYNTPCEDLTIDQRLEELCPHPALKHCGPFIQYQTEGAARHPHEAEIRLLVQYFLLDAHRKLWVKSNIHTAEYQKAFEYIMERYFRKYRNMKEVRSRISQMEMIINQQKRFIDQELGRFTMYPVQFFDLDRQLRKNDYSGFKGLWQLAYERGNQKQVSIKLKKMACYEFLQKSSERMA